MSVAADCVPVEIGAIGHAGEGARATRTTSRGCALAERIDSLLLVVIDIENGHQFRHLQKVSHALGQIGQLDGAATVSRGGIERDQGSEPAAIDVSHARQVENDALALRDHHFYGVAQISGFFAKNDTAGTIDDYNIVYSSDSQFQLHAIPPGKSQLESLSCRVSFLQGLRSRPGRGLRGYVGMASSITYNRASTP